MTPLRLDTIPHYWRCRKCESTDPHVHEVRGEDGLLHWQDHSYDIRDELTRLRAELAEVTKDAERYRWLRNGKTGNEINCTIGGAWSAWINGPELDAAIDADIQKSKP